MVELPGRHPRIGDGSVWVGSREGLEEARRPERSEIQEMAIRGWGRRAAWPAARLCFSPERSGPRPGPRGPGSNVLAGALPTAALSSVAGGRGGAPLQPRACRGFAFICSAVGGRSVFPLWGCGGQCEHSRTHPGDTRGHPCRMYPGVELPPRLLE